MQELSKGIPISIHLTTNVRQAGETENFLFDLQGQAVHCLFFMQTPTSVTTDLTSDNFGLIPDRPGPFPT